MRENGSAHAAFLGGWVWVGRGEAESAAWDGRMDEAGLFGFLVGLVLAKREIG